MFLEKIEEKSFTLIELLVVIAIIGLLSSVVLVALKGAKNKARYAQAQQEIKQFTRMAVIAQGETGKTLLRITGSGCSDCVCRGRNIQSLADSDSCVKNWSNALSKIDAAASVGDLAKIGRDPWGSPYGLDENEHEFSSSDCRYDTIRTAGEDGRLGTSDDYAVNIPHILCP
jgi:prepilin-type N-terminal cleavage/methylation domain-containing protein